MVCGLQYRFLLTAMTFESKVNVKYTYNQFVTGTPLSFFDRGCLFLTQLLLVVCKLQRKLQITAMTWD